MNGKAAAPAKRTRGPKKTIDAPPPRPAKAGGRKVNAPAPVRDAVRRVEGLHSLWRNAVKAHSLRVEGQFRALSQALAGKRRRSAKDIERVRAAAKVHLKPRKGRAKDLRRVEEALDNALARLRD